MHGTMSARNYVTTDNTFNSPFILKQSKTNKSCPVDNPWLAQWSSSRLGVGSGSGFSLTVA